MSTAQEFYQIHLLPASASRTLAAHAALAAEAAKREAPTPPLPRINFEHFSGRGVRYRLLRPEEKDGLLAIAAGLVGPSATIAELNSRRWTEGAKRMLVAVTRKTELKTLDGLPETEWEHLDDAKLDALKGDAWKFEKLFTSKDSDVLRSIFRRLHDATEADVDEIEGKATPVISE